MQIIREKKANLLEYQRFETNKILTDFINWNEKNMVDFKESRKYTHYTSAQKAGLSKMGDDVRDMFVRQAKAVEQRNDFYFDGIVILKRLSLHNLFNLITVDKINEKLFNMLKSSNQISEFFNNLFLIDDSNVATFKSGGLNPKYTIFFVEDKSFLKSLIELYALNINPDENDVLDILMAYTKYLRVGEFRISDAYTNDFKPALKK